VTLAAVAIDVDPFCVREMTGAERAAVMRRVLEDHPQLAELIPERPRAVEGSPKTSRSVMRTGLQ
jgi:hypothetical protein